MQKTSLILEWIAEKNESSMKEFWKDGCRVVTGITSEII